MAHMSTDSTAADGTGPGHHEVGARVAQIAADAHVSELAVVGAPGEWIGQPSNYSAIVRSGAVVREFARVHAGCVRHTVIDEGAFVMSGAYVAHDVIVGRLAHIGPGALVGGLVEIGDHSRIGIGAVVRPKSKIGRNVIVGAGAVVTKDIPDNQVWAGNPARFMKMVDRRPED
jgi:acetyltransferase-like isoleucine patch superfamily enzyme